MMIFVLTVCLLLDLHARSIYRLSSQEIPRLTIRWRGDQQVHILQHQNLEVGPMFTNYDHDYLHSHTLPEGLIAPRDPSVPAFSGADVIKVLEKFVEELRKSYKLRAQYDDVIIIKKKDYNPRSHAGLIIVKLKKYPVVAKIFIESPASFASPFSKGLEPTVFFMMGSINRHMSGFLRIKNAETIRELIAQDPYWNTRVDIPRKWFWTPEHQQFLEISSNNLGTREHRVTLPSVYAVIADAIVPDEHFNILNKNHRAKALELCHFLGIRVDPHINNFMIEKGSKKLILVDTEHFPSMVGLREPFVFDTYGDWYCKLVGKGFVDIFGRTKPVRKAIQGTDNRLVLEC